MNKQTDYIRFLALLSGVSDYYGKALSEGVQDLYWNGLEQYDIEAVEKAFWEHTQNPDNGQFMPKIADITRAMQGRTQDQAAVAWSKVDAAVRRVGTYADVVFDDPIIHRVIAEMGGWIWFGQQVEDDWPFIAKRFEAMYRSYKVRGEVPDYQPVLTGMANAQNQQNGFKGQPPILIGNEQRAQAVLAGGVAGPLIQMRQASATVHDINIKRIAK